MLGTQLRQPLTGSAAEGDTGRIGPEKHLPYPTGDGGAERMGAPGPAGHPGGVGRLDLDDPPAPVDVEDCPAAAGEDEHGSATAAVSSGAGHEGLVGDQADLGPAVADAEDGRRGERRQQLHEVPAAKDRLGLAADTQDAAVVHEEPRGDQVVGDRGHGRGSLRPERERLAEPLRPQLATDTAFLEAQREELLGDEMKGSGWRHDRLDIPLAPAEEHSGGAEQGIVAGGEDQRVAGGVGPAAAAPEALEERGDGGWGVDLDDPVEVSDVDAELQGRGGDDDAVAVLGERLLSGRSLAGAEGSVGDERRHIVTAQGDGELLGAGAAVDEYQAFLAPVEAGDDQRGVG